MKNSVRRSILSDLMVKHLANSLNFLLLVFFLIVFSLKTHSQTITVLEQEIIENYKSHLIDNVPCLAIPYQEEMFNCTPQNPNYIKTPCTQTRIYAFPNENSFFKIYPNPVSDYFYINMPEGIASGYIKIISQEGQILQEVKIEDSLQKIKISSKKSGSYIIELDSEKGMFFSKILIK